MDSILESVKKMLGDSEGYEYFDPDIIMYINSALATLTQIGVGPVEGFSIESSEEKWSDITDDTVLLGFIKPYIYKKVKLAFDPPQSSFALEAMNKLVAEDEWRINVHVDPGKR